MADRPDDPVVASVLAVQAGRLDEAQLLRLRERAERLRQQIATLDRYHLENGDEPDSTFGPADGLDRA